MPLIDITDIELQLIKELIIKEIEYGVTIDKTRMLIELYDNLDKIYSQKE